MNKWVAPTVILFLLSSCATYSPYVPYSQYPGYRGGFPTSIVGSYGAPIARVPNSAFRYPSSEAPSIASAPTPSGPSSNALATTSYQAPGQFIEIDDRLRRRIAFLLDIPSSDLMVLPAGVATGNGRSWLLYPICLAGRCTPETDNMFMLAAYNKATDTLATGHLRDDATSASFCREEGRSKVCNDAPMKYISSWKRSKIISDWEDRKEMVSDLVGRANRLRDSDAVISKCFDQKTDPTVTTTYQIGPYGDRTAAHRDYRVNATAQNTCSQAVVFDLDCNAPVIGYDGPVTVQPGETLHGMPVTIGYSCKYYALKENPF